MVMISIEMQEDKDIFAFTDIILTFLSFELQKWACSQNWSEFNQESNSGLTFLLGPLKPFSYRAVPRYLFNIALHKNFAVLVVSSRLVIHNNQGNGTRPLACTDKKETKD